MASVADSLSNLDPKTLAHRLNLSNRRKCLYASMFHGHVALIAHNGTVRCKKLIPRASEETMPGLAKALDTFSRLLADVLQIPLGARGAKTVNMSQLQNAAAQLCQDGRASTGTW